MTGPLGENEVEIGELGDHDFNKSVADFTIGGATDEAYYRRTTRNSL